MLLRFKKAVSCLQLYLMRLFSMNGSSWSLKSLAKSLMKGRSPIYVPLSARVKPHPTEKTASRLALCLGTFGTSLPENSAFEFGVHKRVGSLQADPLKSLGKRNFHAVSANLVFKIFIFTEWSAYRVKEDFIVRINTKQVHMHIQAVSEIVTDADFVIISGLRNQVSIYRIREEIKQFIQNRISETLRITEIRI